MPTRARIFTAALSDGVFIASVAAGAIAHLLEDTSAALRELALSKLPPALTDCHCGCDLFDGLDDEDVA